MYRESGGGPFVMSRNRLHHTGYILLYHFYNSNVSLGSEWYIFPKSVFSSVDCILDRFFPCQLTTPSMLAFFYAYPTVFIGETIFKYYFPTIRLSSYAILTYLSIYLFTRSLS